MEQQLNQHEKSLSIALKEFYTREIKDLKKAQDLVKRHRNTPAILYQLQSVIFDYGLVAAIKAGTDDEGNVFECKKIRAYLARYSNESSQPEENKQKPNKPTMVIELIGNDDKGKKISRYFNYGQTCPPGDDPTGILCDGDILDQP